MDEISQDDFNKVIEMYPEKKDNVSAEVSEVEFDKMLKDMENPVQAQKHVAVQIKIFLDKRISDEMDKKGYLSDHTRRWVESYNNILEKIQKALHGDKSVNLHLHKVTHSQVAEKMREAMK